MAATRFVYFVVLIICLWYSQLIHCEGATLGYVETTEDPAITTEQFEVTAQDITALKPELKAIRDQLNACPGIYSFYCSNTLI